MEVTILILDGEQRSSLAAVRSLGREGHRVLVGSHRTRPLAGASRHASRSLLLPDPLIDPASYVDRVVERVRQEDVRVVLPMTDASHLALFRARQRLGSTVVPGPSKDAFRAISDKARLTDVAGEIGLRTPGQLRLDEPGGAAPDRLDELAYPLVLKPARSVSRRRKLGVSYARCPRELSRRLGALPPEAFPLLLQERVVGPGVGIFLLRWEGRLLGRFSHRRLREKPPSGGVSVYRESIPADPDLVLRCERLLAAHDWQGPAMVEFKVDEASGTPFLMEVNGRFWGSLQLAVDAGVDFPALLVRAALGEKVAPVETYRDGLRLRWWWGDVDHLIARLRTREKPAPDSPGRLRTLASFLRLWWPGDRFEVLRPGDPGPFLRESRQWLGALVP